MVLHTLIAMSKLPKPKELDLASNHRVEDLTTDKDTIYPFRELPSSPLTLDDILKPPNALNQTLPPSEPLAEHAKHALQAVINEWHSKNTSI
jgi:hypothetical protein